jgi:transcriptional regulator with XRE-family HTH domain
MLAQRLKECRKSKGVSQKDIADFLGIITTSYQNMSTVPVSRISKR